jgi:peroxin-12
LLPILNSFDEIYALVMLVVERHYLLAYGGGFTENFYGLKRERMLQIKGGEARRTQSAVPSLVRETLQLKRSDVWKNLAVMVGLPYLKRKLDESYEIHIPQAQILGPRHNRDTLPSRPTFRQRIMYYYKWFLRNIYPNINAAYYFSLLAFSLAYLFDNTKYSSPFLFLIGTRIRRLGEADYRVIALAADPPAVGSASGPGAFQNANTSIFNPRTLAIVMFPRLLSSLKVLLPTSIFALKFLEWWHASDFARQLSRKATEGLDLPPPIVSGLPRPPHRTSTESSPVRVRNSVALSAKPGRIAASAAPTTTNIPPAQKLQPPVAASSQLPILTVPAPTTTTSALCPICLRPIVTPTASQTGYTYCYTCIFKWVEGSHARQVEWMEGTGDWGDEEMVAAEKGECGNKSGGVERKRNREGVWESGKGRCAVTGRRLLGGTEGLRRVIA